MTFVKEPPPIVLKVSPEEYSAWLSRQRNWDTLRQITSSVNEINLLTGVTKVADVIVNEALDPDNDITSGTGWFTVIKTSASTYLCTYTALDTWNHSSASSAVTSAIIPSTYRPNSPVKHVHDMGATGVSYVNVTGAGGSIQFIHRDWAGSFVNRTTVGGAFSLSWIAGELA